MLKKTFILLFIFASLSLYAKDVLDDIQEEERTDTATNEKPNLSSEKIKLISTSKKILILTNSNQSFSKGDYISILIANELVFRALVAKTTADKDAGIKLIKIYSLPLWEQIKPGKDVLVLKGDDSYYYKQIPQEKDKNGKKEKNNKKEKEKEVDDGQKIQSDEDLFNSTTLKEDENPSDENSKRLIKPDNLVGFNYGLLSSKDNTGAATRYGHMNASWGYQLTDNIWSELELGSNTIRDYPNANGLGGLDTQLIGISFRAKYTYPAPFYSYLMPYVGYQIVMANSPSAGKADANNTNTTILDKEKQMVDSLKQSGPIFGLTVLKRIVPGWFARVDLGTDIVSGGLTLEF